MENWVSKLKFKQKTFDEIQNWSDSEDDFSPLQCEFTDIIIIGGDGLLSQYLNSCYKHHFFDTLIKIPICILPGGTGNALSWDLGGKEPLNLCMCFLRGEMIKGDILRVDFETSQTSILATAIAWGFGTKVIESSESWRGCLGTSRYTVWGTREVLCTGGPWSMTSHKISKAQYNDDVPSNLTRKPVHFSKFEEDKEIYVSMNVPKKTHRRKRDENKQLSL